MKPKVEIDLNILKKNIEIIKNEVTGINLLFPVKCCTNNKVLKIINKNNFGYDISNMNEYNLIKKYLKGNFVSATGPLSYELLSVKYKNMIIVANNLNSFQEGMGLRINFNGNKNFEKSRFGIDYKLLSNDICDKITYLHFHNSDKRNEEKCRYIFDELEIILGKFKNLKTLDIGGHLEDLSFEDGINYLKNIRKIVPNNIEVNAELGDFLFKNTGTLYCEVVDVREDDNVQLVTLNFSKMANQRWAYPYYNDESNNKIKTIFYGCSCCETDTFLETYSKKLKKYDRLQFSNISPYSYQWNIGFNGIEKLKYIFK